MCTSKSEDTDKSWAEQQGAVDYIVKPYSPEDMISRIRDVLTR